MSSDSIHVQFASISGGATDIEGIALQIKNDLNHLEQVLRPVVNTWSGEARDAYHNLQTQWDTAAADIQKVTHEVSSALHITHGNYSKTEDTNKSMWGG